MSGIYECKKHPLHFYTVRSRYGAVCVDRVARVREFAMIQFEDRVLGCECKAPAR